MKNIKNLRAKLFVVVRFQFFFFKKKRNLERKPNMVFLNFTKYARFISFS